MARQSIHGRLALARISSASSRHGQKGGGVEASESYFEVFIAARNAMHSHSHLRYLLISSQSRINLECLR